MQILTVNQIEEYGRQYEELNRRVFSALGQELPNDSFLSGTMNDLIKLHYGIVIESDKTNEELAKEVKEVLKQTMAHIRIHYKHPDIWKINSFDEEQMKKDLGWLELSNIVKALLRTTPL